MGKTETFPACFPEKGPPLSHDGGDGAHFPRIFRTASGSGQTQ